MLSIFQIFDQAVCQCFLLILVRWFDSAVRDACVSVIGGKAVAAACLSWWTSMPNHAPPTCPPPASPCCQTIPQHSSKLAAGKPNLPGQGSCCFEFAQAVADASRPL